MQVLSEILQDSFVFVQIRRRSQPLGMAPI